MIIHWHAMTQTYVLHASTCKQTKKAWFAMIQKAANRRLQTEDWMLDTEGCKQKTEPYVGAEAWQGTNDTD